ncbi:hypothetical protein ACDY97_03840 [Rhizobium mongolense]|uniref:hypothetical protein n=1 Tax=Rhizobium mongolense TaxID=57676 RepID=UPI0035569AED
MRETFKGIADILIPNAEGMPAASEVGVHEDLDMIIGLRPDLKEDFVRGLRNVVGKDPWDAANTLNMEDADALTAIGLVASAAYYMSPIVREKIGYPGQQSRPDPDPDATPEYVSNGMLQKVIDRGSIFRSTIK